MALNGVDRTLKVRSGSLDATSMRYHELAVQRWLNSFLQVREGYPIPVVLTSPMDAFSEFRRLWGQSNNPYAYLYEAKDERGAPLYQPYPAPAVYPILSLHRKGWKLRNYQNFSIHRWRHINWPTVSSTGPAVFGVESNGTELTKCDLANVTTSRMPMAFDYRFQLDFFSNRTDTVAFYLNQLFNEFWRTGGPTLQTWITVAYPGWGPKQVRLYIDGDVEQLTPEEPENGKNVEFRTSVNIVLEGFDVDLRYRIFPAFWTLVYEAGSGAGFNPELLERAFEIVFTEDVRIHNANPTLDSRENVPPDGGCSAALESVDNGGVTIVEG